MFMTFSFTYDKLLPSWIQTFFLDVFFIKLKARQTWRNLFSCVHALIGIIGINYGICEMKKIGMDTRSIGLGNITTFFPIFLIIDKLAIEQSVCQKSCIVVLVKQRKNNGGGFDYSTGLLHISYSQVLSHYCLTRELLSAMFPSWTNTFLLMQPGELRFLKAHHIDAQ